VPQHDDLQLLERLGATTKQHGLEQPAAQQIGERPEQKPAPRNQQDGPTTLRPTRVSQTANRVNAPFSLRGASTRSQSAPGPMREYLRGPNPELSPRVAGAWFAFDVQHRPQGQERSPSRLPTPSLRCFSTASASRFKQRVAYAVYANCETWLSAASRTVATSPVLFQTAWWRPQWRFSASSFPVPVHTVTVPPGASVNVGKR
jgi:hypothetical protein